MEGNTYKHSTPARKMSLRRKRSNKPEGNGESPVHKKVSPSSRKDIKRELSSIKNEIGNPRTNEESTSQVYRTRRSTVLQSSTHMTGMSTPKNSKGSRSTSRKNSIDLSSELEEQRMGQHSPDTPFMSSQLCGTQECEVVWDCDSPGFSKDDVKRMSTKAESDESPSPVFVVPVPHRALFTRTRSRIASTAPASNATAQLDELLSQLTAKGSLPSTSNGASSTSRSKPQSVSENTPLSEGLIFPHSPPVTEKDSLQSSPPIPPDLTMNASQPFKIEECSESKEGMSSKNCEPLEIPEDDISWDDLDTALCDVSHTEEVPDSQSKTSENTVNNYSLSSTRKVEKTNDSLDIFDDDYFNDTLIESTQALEKEILGNEEQVPSSKATLANKSKGAHHSMETQVPSSKATSANMSKEAHHSMQKESRSKLDSISSFLSKAESGSVSESKDVVGSSPVLGKYQVPVEKVLQRRVRNTFRLDGHFDTHSTLQKSSILKTDVNKNKMSSDSTKVSDQTHIPMPKNCDLKAELPKSRPRKALFVGSNSSKYSDGITGKVDSPKNAFPRSQSTGNVASKNKLSPTVPRPSKSEDAEGSKEFEEDDSFFESLVCTFPEDDMIFGDLKNSAITEKQQKTKHPFTEVATSSKSIAISSTKNEQNNSKLGLSNKPHLVSESSSNKSNNVTHGNKFNQRNSEKSLVNPKSNPPAKSEAAIKQQASTSFPSDMLDDDLFEDDVLSLIDEVESQFGSQPLPISSQPTQTSPSSQSIRCTSDEIARKKEGAQRRREEKMKKEELSKKKDEPLFPKDEKPKPFEGVVERENRLKAEDIARKRAEALRKKEEAERKRKEAQLREEKQRFEELSQKREETLRIKEEQQRAEEIARKREEAKRIKEDRLKEEEEKKKREEIARKREEALRLREEKLKEEIARKKEEALRRREEKQRLRQQQQQMHSIPFK